MSESAIPSVSAISDEIFSDPTTIEDEWLLDGTDFCNSDEDDDYDPPIFHARSIKPTSVFVSLSPPTLEERFVLEQLLLESSELETLSKLCCGRNVSIKISALARAFIIACNKYVDYDDDVTILTSPTSEDVKTPSVVADAFLSTCVGAIFHAEQAAWTNIIRLEGAMRTKLFVKESVASGESRRKQLIPDVDSSRPPKDKVETLVASVCPAFLNGAPCDSNVIGGVVVGSDFIGTVLAALASVSPSTPLVNVDLSTVPFRSSLRGSSCGESSGSSTTSLPSSLPPSPRSDDDDGKPKQRRLSFSRSAIVHPHIVKAFEPPMINVVASECAKQLFNLTDAFGRSSLNHPLSTGEFAFAFGPHRRWCDVDF